MFGIYSRIKSKIHWLKSWVHRFRPWIIRPNKIVFLFGCPGHSNLGDQAQTYCIEKWLKENYPDYEIRFFTLKSVSEDVFSDLRRFIRKQDLIMCHSGYHFTDLYHECDVYKKMANLFPDYRITIFPQTIFFKSQTALEETAEIFNNHGNTLLMCRDAVSYKTAQQYFTKCRLLLMPDIVTSLIGSLQFKGKRNGVLFCIRNDKEAFYNKADINALRRRFSAVQTEMTDTTLNMVWQEIAANRECVLFNEIKKYAQFKVVITDRYHGTIFSLIAGTPVVVLGTNDHKLSSGVTWFPNEYKDYVFFVSNLDDAYERATMILKRGDLSHKLPPYFKNKFYKELKQQIQ